MPKLAEKILEIRKQNDLTQDDFAEKLGVTRQSVSKWEIGQAVPRNSTINKICKEFDVSKSELLGEKYNDNITITTRKQFYKTLTIVLLSLIILLISFAYRIYTLYKFYILTEITNQVSKYEYLDNYYCKVEEYLNDKAKNRTEIWYKDGVYKIKTKSYNNSEDLISISLKWINCNTGMRTQYDYETKELTNIKQYIEENKQDVIEQLYINGKYMYTLFPNILKSTEKEIIYMSLVVNSINIYNLTEEIQLTINENNTILDKNYLPIFYKSIVGNEYITKQYTVSINSVSDEDIEIKKDL